MQRGDTNEEKAEAFIDTMEIYWENYHLDQDDDRMEIWKEI